MYKSFGLLVNMEFVATLLKPDKFICFNGTCCIEKMKLTHKYQVDTFIIHNSLIVFSVRT